MRKITLTFLVLSFLVFVVSCSYNKTELPEPIADPVDAPAPGPSNSITYATHVKSYIDNNCVSCHGSSGGVTLQTYAQVKAQADAGRILARAINGSGSGPMPPSGLMPQTTLDTLQLWLDQGALE